jgi:hypothetical protein
MSILPVPVDFDFGLVAGCSLATAALRIPRYSSVLCALFLAVVEWGSMFVVSEQKAVVLWVLTS